MSDAIKALIQIMSIIILIFYMFYMFYIWSAMQCHTKPDDLYPIAPMLHSDDTTVSSRARQRLDVILSRTSEHDQNVRSSEESEQDCSATITLLCQEASTQAIGFGETPEHDSYASGTWPNSVLSDTNAEESMIVSAPKDSNPTIETPGTFSRDNSLAIQPFTTNWLNPFVNNYSNGNDLNDYFDHLVPDFNDQLVCYKPEASYAAYTDLFASLSYDMP
ncbi:hypothetical protein IFR05_016037 [Cadophora sp. M221]|nr:hypothetical protein IFR05_016037 [Cadophora sp. M221]